MHGRRRAIVPIVILAVIAGAAIWYLNSQAAGATGPLTASGTIEATEVTIAPEIAGRVEEVRVAAGDAVAAGDVLLTLDGAVLEAQHAQAAAAVEAAGAAVDTAQAALAAAQASVELLEAGPSAEELAVAERQVDQAATAYRALRDAYDDLSSAAEDTAAGKALKARRDNARAALETARARQALVKAGPRDEQVAAARAQADAAGAQVETARAQLAAAEAAVALVEAQIAKLTLVAPAAGTVLARSIEPGEAVTPGAALLELGDLERLTLTVFVPENRYGQVALGQAVDVVVDSFPGETFGARVARISDKAEFTPRNVQTAEGRASTVFAIDLALEPSDGRLRPGMPADVTFR